MENNVKRSCLISVCNWSNERVEETFTSRVYVYVRRHVNLCIYIYIYMYICLKKHTYICM